MSTPQISNVVQSYMMGKRESPAKKRKAGRVHIKLKAAFGKTAKSTYYYCNYIDSWNDSDDSDSEIRLSDIAYI